MRGLIVFFLSDNPDNPPMRYSGQVAPEAMKAFQFLPSISTSNRPRGACLRNRLHPPLSGLGASLISLSTPVPLGLRPATGYLAAGFPSAGKLATPSRGKDGNRDDK